MVAEQNEKMEEGFGSVSMASTVKDLVLREAQNKPHGTRKVIVVTGYHEYDFIKSPEGRLSFIALMTRIARHIVASIHINPDTLRIEVTSGYDADFKMGKISVTANS
jgi:hypothetical protein